MAFGWRRKRIITSLVNKNNNSRIGMTKKQEQHQGGEEQESVHPVVVPAHFLCPISLDLMTDPVTLSSGISYDRDSIETWLKGGNFTCPVTNQTLLSFDLLPNHSLRRMIQDWCVQNCHYGVVRIPTPRVPVSNSQISALLLRLETSAARQNHSDTLDLLRKLNGWGNESERNRNCIVSAGAASVLAAAFHGFAASRSAVLEELLASISWMFPIVDSEAHRRLGSVESVNALIGFLKPNSNGKIARDLSVKHNALAALKELLLSSSCSSNRERVAESMLGFQGLDEILFGFLKSPISPTITKSTLTLIFALLQIATESSDRFKSSLISMGTVDYLLDITIDSSSSSSNRSISEKALGVLDRLCESPEGRAAASRNSLTVPLLVKKILRISAAATGFSVSVIWKLGRSEQRALVEGLQVGAFQKLVLVLQLGCGDETKEKATAVLKLMNPYRKEYECTESVDFKNLKRSF